MGGQGAVDLGCVHAAARDVDDIVDAAGDGKLDTAEVAVSIRHDHRGLGIGWALLDLLAHEAERRGVRQVISIESRENHAAIELEREKGFRPEPFAGDPALVVLSKVFR
jgi:acetyltransferase